MTAVFLVLVFLVAFAAGFMAGRAWLAQAITREVEGAYQ